MSNDNSRERIIVVVGATGNQGGSVIKHLQKLDETKTKQWKLKGLCRDVTSPKAKELIEKGVEMISCNLNNKQDLIKALKGAFGVFGVTTPGGFGPSASVEHSTNKEYQEGMNLLEACIENNVQHFVFSSLDNVEKVSNGKISVPHFTNKNKVEQEIRKSSIPFKTYVYPPFFNENIPGMMFKLASDRSSATISSGIKPDRKIPLFSVDDMGIVIAEVFKHPAEFNNRKILAAGDYLSFEEMSHVCSKVLKVETRYIEMNEESCAQWMGNEIQKMFSYFNEFGYYQENEQQAVKEARKLFPALLTFEQYVEKNRQVFLKQ